MQIQEVLLMNATEVQIKHFQVRLDTKLSS